MAASILLSHHANFLLTGRLNILLSKNWQLLRTGSCQVDSALCWPGISAGKMLCWLSTLLTWHFCWQDARLTQHHADLAFLLARCQADSAPCWPGISAGKMPGWSIILRTWFLQLTSLLDTLLTWYCQLPGWPYHLIFLAVERQILTTQLTWC